MIVFSTLRSEQIDLKRSQAKGVEGLKNFLEFAKTGTIINNASNSLSDSPSLTGRDEEGLSSLVADELRQQGFEVETMVGSSEFKVDVAVVDPDHPERYLLGILCDGKNYYETKTARDREIVQPTVLGRLHWNVMRVWAVDWYANHEAVVDRIKKKIEDIRNHKEPEESETEAVPELKVEPLATAPSAPSFSLPHREGRGGSPSRDIKDIPMSEIHFFLLCMKVKSENEVAQWCPTLSHPMDCLFILFNGSSVVFQGRITSGNLVAQEHFINSRILVLREQVNKSSTSSPIILPGPLVET